MHAECMERNDLSMKNISECMGSVWRKIKSIWGVYGKIRFKYGWSIDSVWIMYG